MGEPLSRLFIFSPKDGLDGIIEWSTFGPWSIPKDIPQEPVDGKSRHLVLQRSFTCFMCAIAPRPGKFFSFGVQIIFENPRKAQKIIRIHDRGIAATGIIAEHSFVGTFACHFQILLTLVDEHSIFANLYEMRLSTRIQHGHILSVAQLRDVRGIILTIFAIAMNANRVVRLGRNLSLNLATSTLQFGSNEWRVATFDGTEDDQDTSCGCQSSNRSRHSCVAVHGVECGSLFVVDATLYNERRSELDADFLGNESCG